MIDLCSILYGGNNENVIFGRNLVLKMEVEVYYFITYRKFLVCCQKSLTHAHNQYAQQVL